MFSLHHHSRPPPLHLSAARRRLKQLSRYGKTGLLLSLVRVPDELAVEYAHLDSAGPGSARVDGWRGVREVVEVAGDLATSEASRKGDGVDDVRGGG